MAQTLPPPSIALQGVATTPSRLFPQFRGCGRGVAATPPAPKRALSPHPGPFVGCCGWFGPPKPCRAPWGVAAILAGVALHFDTKLQGKFVFFFRKHHQKLDLFDSQALSLFLREQCLKASNIQARTKERHRQRSRERSPRILLGKGAISPLGPPPRLRGGRGRRNLRTVTFLIQTSTGRAAFTRSLPVLSTECSIMGTISRVLLQNGPSFPSFDRRCTLSTRLSDRNLFEGTGESSPIRIFLFWGARGVCWRSKKKPSPTPRSPRFKK